MRLRLISDGTPGGTQVIDENGEPVDGVQAFTLEHDRNQATDLFLTITVKVGDEADPPTITAEEDDDEYRIVKKDSRFDVMKDGKAYAGGFVSREAAEVYIESLVAQGINSSA